MKSVSTLFCLIIRCGNIAGCFDADKASELLPFTHAGTWLSKPAEYLCSKIRMLADPYLNAHILNADGKKLKIKEGRRLASEHSWQKY